jgi:uncharacterized repeat protein (TIGR01451 family)
MRSATADESPEARSAPGACHPDPAPGQARRKPSRHGWRQLAALTAALALPLAAVAATQAGPAWASSTCSPSYAGPMSLGSNTILGAGVAVDPATCTVYVALPSDSDVQVLSEQTGQLLTTISLITAADPDPEPVAVAVDPTTSTVFVANRNTNSVSVISEAQNPVDDALTNTISLNAGADPVAVAVDPTTSTVFVTGGSNNVSVISEAQNPVDDTLASTISLSTAADPDPDPVAVAVDPDTGTVFVADNGFNSVSAISESTDDVTSISLDSASLDHCGQPTAIQPNGIAVDPDTGTVFVTNGGFVDNANTESDNVSVISETDPQDPADDELECPIGLPYQDNPNQGSIPAAVAVDPETGTVFVTDSALGLVSVISEATDSITTNVTVPNLGNDPALGVAVDPDTGTAYVVNDESIDGSDFDVRAIPSGSSSSCGSSSLCYQLAQSIGFTAPASGTYGGQATLTPSATSGLPVTLSVDPSSGAGACSLSGDTVFYAALGSCVIDANQAGDSGYLSAPQVSQTITVGQAPLTITASSATTTYGSPVPSITAGYSGLVNGDTSASLSTQPGCSTTATSSSPAGQYPSDCSGAVDPDYTITYAAGMVTVNQATQSITFTGPPATGVVGKSATLTASGGGSGNPVTFSVDASSGAGVCSVSGDTVSYTAAGSCVTDANQAGNANYTAAPQVSLTITVNQAPAFVTDSPPLTAVAGQAYGYTFAASGVPAPTYKLAPGAPSWLSINASTGVLTGTLPALQLLPFTYSVIASNAAGTATAGPFTVKPQLGMLSTADVSVTMSCPASMTVGGTGTCTLTASNTGPATATGVVADVLLPSQLSEVSCTAGCTPGLLSVGWSLGSLVKGASANFAVTLTANAPGPAQVRAVAEPQNPGTSGNSTASQLITINS